MLKEGVLRGKKNFDLVYRKGRSKGDKYVVIFCIPNGLEQNRVAYVASKKVGNSVKRHRAIRLLRECHRNLDGLKQGYDIIFVARNTMNGKKCQTVFESVRKAAGRAGLLK